MRADRETWETASRLIEQHGEDAKLEVARQADAALDAGDVDGERRLIQVLQAVTWLQDHRGRDPYKVEH